MCELKVIVTPEKFLELSGYSLQGFLDWKKSNAAPAKKQTREDWLNQHRDCAHCLRDGSCSRQHFGYVKPYSGECATYNVCKEFGKIKHCCEWNGDVANALHNEVDKLIKKGEVIENGNVN